ncbi:hypothetical protein KVT40_003575 [Elsinoe batatas]|uniref:FAD/NAD(P)-binding domain-containing protein n=1 Tax=Elsinoe batatas TaxID=2601811 RepID=A0A8K0L281_9PEZI|nr:hypothetical protein KVT40_003575 [Elsinoe batatas]
MHGAAGHGYHRITLAAGQQAQHVQTSLQRLAGAQQPNAVVAAATVPPTAHHASATKPTPPAGRFRHTHTHPHTTSPSCSGRRSPWSPTPSNSPLGMQRLLSSSAPVRHMRTFATGVNSTCTQRFLAGGTGVCSLSRTTKGLSNRSAPLALIKHSYPGTNRYLATISDDMSVHRSKYAAVVVGAGPAGICAVGNMLERKVGPILWVDDEFNAGRVNRNYREVPSNTKTKLFIDFAEALTPFKQVLDKTPSPNAIDHLRGLNQEKGTYLGDAADMLLMLTRGLMQTPGVEVRKGRVTSASVDSHKGWTVQVSLAGHDSPIQSQPSTVIADRVILCTGSSPTEGELPVSVPGMSNINLDTALSPSTISQFIPKDKPVTIAVIGASHSAILVLWNLANLALSSHPKLHIKWFTRHSLRYAEFMDGWILRDNTGLKGDAAVWAKENLEPEVLPSSPVAKCITPISYQKDHELDAYKEHLPGTDYCIQAIGYTRDPIPDLKRGVGTLEAKYNHRTGGFEDGKGEKVPGLYGAGIAWPERVTDPHGNVEYAVGFFKFMKYMKRVACDWN